MGSTTSAGSKLFLSAALPASETLAGYEALTFTKVGGLESIGAIGATTSVVTFQPLDGPQEKHKGSTNYGSLQPAIGHDKDDAGQTLLRTACEPNNNALYAAKVEMPNGDKRYFQFRGFGYPENIGNADSIVMANPTLEINSVIIKDDA